MCPVAAGNWIDAYFRLEHGAESGHYRMLRQAMASRRALLLLDGLDEGGAAREEIERHVADVLALQGHPLVATSRPDGITLTEAQLERFNRMSMAPLSAAQQRTALQLRMGALRSAELVDYVERQVLVDPDTGAPMTTNPLMLSMIATIHELRSGVGMPRTITELYQQATKVMIARAKVSDEAINIEPLVRAICIEAHSDKQRIVELKHIQAAAKRVANGDRVLLLLVERLVQDQIPIFTLLLPKPL
eukprot:3313500-Prymnesium_polylepis.1